MRFLKWIVDRLEHPRAAHAVIAIALALATPSLLSPMILDDHVIAMKAKAAVQGTGWAGFLNDCFVFTKPEPDPTSSVPEDLFGAWWAPSGFRFAFWRPLSAATHALDQLLWPHSPLAMHLHTLAWFVALLFCLNTLYRRFFSARIASLALALYAWDDARGMVLGWVANRNALVAGVLAASTLIAHDKWRRDRCRAAAGLAPLLFALDLLSAEMAIATLAYLAAYACFLDEGPPRRRMLTVVPYALIASLWQALYVTAGYGIEGSGIYIAPLAHPLDYATKLLERAPVLLLGQLTPIDSSFWGLYPPVMKGVVLAMALLVSWAVARLIRASLATEPGWKFWLFGALLALAPISATGPADRNLVFVGMGASAVLAMLFVKLTDTPAPGRKSRIVAGGLVLCNLALAPLLMPVKCLSIVAEQAFFGPFDNAIPKEPWIRNKTLVVVWIGTEVALYASSSSRDARGIPRPGRMRTLAGSGGELSVTRVDAETLRLRASDGFFGGEARQLLRSPSLPFRSGDVIRLSDMTATIIELTDDRRPQMVDFRFAAPLESTSWVWMRDDGNGLVAWTPPSVGQTVRVPAGR
jgi:hypothetical protein